MLNIPICQQLMDYLDWISLCSIELLSKAINIKYKNASFSPSQLKEPYLTVPFILLDNQYCLK